MKMTILMRGFLSMNVVCFFCFWPVTCDCLPNTLFAASSHDNSSYSSMLMLPSSPGVALIPILAFMSAILLAIAAFVASASLVTCPIFSCSMFASSFFAALLALVACFSYGVSCVVSSIVLSSVDAAVGCSSPAAPDVSMSSVTLSGSMFSAPVTVVSFIGDTVLCWGVLALSCSRFFFLLVLQIIRIIWRFPFVAGYVWRARRV